MTPGWSHLAWRALPVALIVAWFLFLIGGFGLGGLLHLLLLAAVGIFTFQIRGDRTA